MLLKEDEDVNPDSVEVTLSPWILLTEDERMAVATDWVVTMVEPIDDIKEMYLEKTNGKIDKDSGTD